MTNISKYDVVIVKFPFASSLKYKARPAVVISSNIYNNSIRNTVVILAISSNISSKLDFEILINDWEEYGLLKPSIFKASIATIEKDFVLTKIGKIQDTDKENLDYFIEQILKD
jgi:mRNA interferase MazF